MEVKSDGVISSSLKRQRTAIAVKLERDNSDELKENPEARRSLNQIPQNQWYLAHDGCRRYGIMEIYTEALFSDCRAFNLADHVRVFSL